MRRGSEQCIACRNADDIRSMLPASFLLLQPLHLCQLLLRCWLKVPACFAGVVQYRTQFAVCAAGKLRVTAADAKRNVQLLLTATGAARLAVNGTTLAITGA